ncbi:hypothetical protein C8N46_10987 [Kordia periserrulae]|uniref:Uncharacterized protein n=1 Tax=Kordia periserrulae TaxID=701523 RepID=A0A2T6BTT1_9FLAO|nr:hypothetical protein [Kordia periserrulae]PTX59498.1 hypothetical protein C8N46_10987 [Kordia periserrulae]
MKKRKVNLKQLSLKKSSVASLESNSVTGGYQSWTGTYEPCFSEFDCGTAGCPQETDGCPVYTDGCYTNGCPPQTQNCPPATLLCNSHSVCPAGVQCY